MLNDKTPGTLIMIVIGALLIAYSPSLLAAVTSFAEATTGELSGSVSGYPSESIRVHVVAFLLQTSDGYPWFAKECDSQIDAAGHYSCLGLPSGYYLFYAVPEEEGGIEHRDDSIEHFSRTFYPGTVDIKQAELILVKGGMTSIYNFTLEQAGTYQVMGRMQEKPASAVLSLSSLDEIRGYVLDTSLRVNFDNHKGEFFIDDVPSGSYLLDGRWFVAAPDQHSQIPQIGAIDIEVTDHSVSGLLLGARTHATIDGTVDLDGKTLARAMRIEFQDIADAHHKVAAQVSRNGTFRCLDITSGRYRISQIDLEGEYLKTVSVDGRESAVQQVLIAPGQSQASVSIGLGLKGAVIKGVVVDSGQSASQISIVAKNEATGTIYTSTADSIGRFTIANLPPGDYDLYAWDHLDEIPYAIPHGVDRYRDERIVVSVDEGQTVNGISIPLLNRTGPS
jgi:hypothetical protein